MKLKTYDSRKLWPILTLIMREQSFKYPISLGGGHILIKGNCATEKQILNLPFYWWPMKKCNAWPAWQYNKPTH
jgi:hypothetical protein